MSNSTLYIIASISMLIDHLGYTGLLEWEFARAVGRLAFPIYVYLMVEGVNKTRSIQKYSARLLILAIISEIPYNLMSSGSMIDTRHQNVIFELLFGLIVVALFNSIKQLNKADLTLISNTMLIPILMYAAEKLEFDYGVYGVLLALLFGVVYGSKYEKYLIPVVISFVFILIYNSAYNINILGLPIGIQWFAVIASIPLILYNKKKGLDNKTFRAAKYSFYPIHMLLLSLIILL